MGAALQLYDDLAPSSPNRYTVYMTKAAGPRQQAGPACERCRRRKAWCDRVRPQCGICAEAGRSGGVVDKRSQRGAP
ncbi:hypothetical protein E4U41_002660 [Claviceps citrina]|nr:hypothetical protein E4U41_002660 [Claviceps citrina]